MSANEMPRSVSAEREDRGSIILRDTVPFLILAWLIVAARLLSRRLVKAFIGGDDYMIVAALVRQIFLVLQAPTSTLFYSFAEITKSKILASGTALGSYTRRVWSSTFDLTLLKLIRTGIRCWQTYTNGLQSRATGIF